MFEHARRNESNLHASTRRWAFRRRSALPTSSSPALLCAVFLAGYLPGLLPQACAQERYDDHEITDRLFVSLGAYSTRKTNSTIQVQSKRTGVGAIIDAENLLGIERSVTVARLDGYFRLNRAHRFEWTYYDQTRYGKVVLDKDLEIGDLIFPVAYTLGSEWNLRLLKAGYAWSFINTSKYEFYLGAGLNIRGTTLRLRGESNVGGTIDIRTFDESATLPLPTATMGLHYRLSDRLSFQVRSETFFLEIGDSSGRLQDNLFMADYRIGRHVGVGGGIDFFSFDVETDFDDDNRFRSHTDNIGLELFVAAQF